MEKGGHTEVIILKCMYIITILITAINSDKNNSNSLIELSSL